jgi:hypothetical protein
MGADGMDQMNGNTAGSSGHIHNHREMEKNLFPEKNTTKTGLKGFEPLTCGLP